MSGEQARPWIEGNLSIPKALLEQLHQHALECYPNECCGFVSGPVTEPLQLTAAQREINEADKYHELDPVTFPRTARTYFKIN
ncbi:MAG TPA: Mov34/MPN/PAD-1 family protein, partial [Polyangiales bacterium]|nr:Mov34/MPN/PAD-1 family protein [Polyangiales bacterium]